MKLRLLCISMIAWVPVAAVAQPLVDRIPDDTMVYVGWKGSDALGPQYNASKFKKFIDSSNIPRIISDVVPQLIEKASTGEPGKADEIKIAQHFAEMIAKHPTAFFVAGFDAIPGEKQAQPKLGLICDAGGDKDTLLALFKKMAQDDNAKGNELHVRAISDGDVVGLVFGFNDEERVIAGANGDGRKSLASTDRFAAAKSQIAPDAAIVIYSNVETVLSKIDAGIKMTEGEQAYTAWTRGRDASGITGLKQYVFSAGFTGEDWTSNAFLEAAAPRTGLLKLLEPAPIDPALQSRIPADATSASISQFDFAALIGTIRDITNAVDPQAGKKLQQALGFISISIGRNLEREILAPLGSQWAMYTAPSLGGSGVNGLVIVNKLDDAKLAKAAWGDLAFAISNTLPNVLRQQQGIIATPKFDEQAVPGSSLFSMKIGDSPFVPSWVVKDGYLYIGVDPAVVAKAAIAADAKFVENEAFGAAMKSLDAKNYTAYSFTNLPATASAASAQFDAGWTMLLGPAEKNGIELPNSLLPAVEKVTPLLQPSGSMSWADAKGFYSKERSPFPFAGMTYGYAQGDTAMTTVGVSAVGAAVLLPSLNKARETANRVKGASNLRQIAMATMLHANENKGDAPADLGALLQQDVTVDIFVTPSGSTDIPPAVRNGTAEQKADWINHHSDVVFVKPAGKFSEAPADRPLAYEKIGIHGRDGINIAYCDGHVEFVNTKSAIEQIKAATGAEPVTYEIPKATPAVAK